jgi:hypothetical protein
VARETARKIEREGGRERREKQEVRESKRARGAAPAHEQARRGGATQTPARTWCVYTSASVASRTATSPGAAARRAAACRERVRERAHAGIGVRLSDYLIWLG